MWSPHLPSSKLSHFRQRKLSKKHSEHVSFPSIYTIPHFPWRIKTCWLLSDDLWLKIKIFNPTREAELGPYFCLQCHLTTHSLSLSVTSLSIYLPLGEAIFLFTGGPLDLPLTVFWMPFIIFFLWLNFSYRWLFLKAHSRISFFVKYSQRTVLLFLRPLFQFAWLCLDPGSVPDLLCDHEQVT